MNTLNETNYQDLPQEVLNVDVHNMGLFMFLSMLKCSGMGNYKLRENAYVARESVRAETIYFDASWYNPRDSQDSLFVEMKTRKIGDHEVRYENRIIEDVMDKIDNLLSVRDECRYIVPIIIYKKEHRSFNRLWEADILMMWGDERRHVIGPLLPIKKWHSIIAKAHDVQELMSILDKVYNCWQQEQEQEQIALELESVEKQDEEKQEEEQDEEEEEEEEEQEEDSRSWGSRSWGSRPLEERRFSLAAIGYMVIHYCVKTKDQLITIKGITEQVKATFHQGLHQSLKHPSWWKESLPKMIRDDLIKMVVVNDLDAFEVTKDNIIKDENSRTFFNFKIEDYQLLIESKQMSDEELECLKIPSSQYELIRVEDEGLNDSE